MKKLVEIQEVDREGLTGLLGQTVTFFCMNYFYTGKLVGINDTCVRLDDPKIIYSTGPWTSENWDDAQHIPSPLYVQVSSIEAFGVMK